MFSDYYDLKIMIQFTTSHILNSAVEYNMKMRMKICKSALEHQVLIAPFFWLTEESISTLEGNTAIN